MNGHDSTVQGKTKHTSTPDAVAQRFIFQTDRNIIFL